MTEYLFLGDGFFFLASVADVFAAVGLRLLLARMAERSGAHWDDGGPSLIHARPTHSGPASPGEGNSRKIKMSQRGPLMPSESS